MKTPTKLAFYHAECLDGATAAALMYHAHASTTEFVPLEWGRPIDIGQCRGREVYFLDIAPRSFADYRAIMDVAAWVTVIDHHRTSAEVLGPAAELPSTENRGTIVFSETESGATLAAEFFSSPDTLRSRAALVADQDLWKFQDVRTREYNAGLELYECTPEAFYTALGRQISAVCREGAAILAARERSIQDHLRRVVWARIRFPEGDLGPKVPVINASDRWSDLLAHALKAHAGAPYAVAFHHRSDGVKYSLRSRTVEECDVSRVAQRFTGGGGHPWAAGFAVRGIVHHQHLTEDVRGEPQ